MNKLSKLTMLMAATAMATGCAESQHGKVSGIDLSYLDTTCSPAKDFYQYATGGWQKNNPLKPEYARFGSFDVLNENNEKRLNDLFKEMSEMSAKKGSVEQKISDIYKMGLDSTRLNAEGFTPVKKYLDQLLSVNDKAELVSLIADMHDNGVASFFGTFVMSDLMDSDSQILYIGQGGLGIGDRDYYTDPKNAEIKEGYRNFLMKVFELAGMPKPEAAAVNALSVEDTLAIHSWTSVQERDMEKLYNPMSTAELETAYPGFDFKAYFAARSIPDQAKLNVNEPSFFEAFSKYFAEADLNVLKEYVAGQLIQDACGSISDDFYDASFDFFSKQMSGITQQKPRWKRAMRVPNSVLGEAVGKMYVEKYFPESSKKKMLKLVKNLQEALGQHIDELDWMSDSTKVKAHDKLDNFIIKIGYPDKWKDYSTLDVDPALSYYENLRAAGKWYVADNMSQLGKPTDKTEWGMTPQTVNAYYNPSTNEICFPAAILQPPFFDPEADDAVNYGAIGVVIGHEMSHGFDDQGRLFDKNGNMVNWWTDEDAAKFNEKAQVLVKQFNAVQILPGLMCNGQLTLGENIGDHGGLSIAYTAMKNATKNHSDKVIDGFTQDQRFYLAYGAIWAQNIRDAEKARLTRLDVHSLAENRVNVSLRNFQSFFDAFGIKEGDPMFRPESERVHIW